MHRSVILYYRGPGETYSQQNSITLNTRSDSTEQELMFKLNPFAASAPSASGDPKKIEALRLNLVGEQTGATTAYLKPYGIHISQYRKEGGNHVSLCTFNDIEDSSQVSRRGLTPCQGPIGDMYVIDETEPTIEIIFPQPVLLTPQSSLEVVFSYDYLPSEDFILARDLYLVQQEKLEQEIRTLQTQLEQSRKTIETNRTYQDSPLWKGFVAVDRWYRRVSQIGPGGILRTCTNMVRPDWWTQRRLTGYERWRTDKGYENKSR